MSHKPGSVAHVRLWTVRFEGTLALSPGRATLQASSGYVLAPDREGRPTITCLLCGLTSWNASDVEHRYCGHCHRYHEVD